MVAVAAAHYDTVGASSAFAKFTNNEASQFRDRDLYVFILSVDGMNRPMAPFPDGICVPRWRT